MREVFLMDKIIKFDFDSWPMPLSHKIIMYICQNANIKLKHLLKLFKNGKKKICGMEKINLYRHKTVSIDYVGTRGYHYIYKEK